MTKPRELRFNVFNMTAPSHNWAGLWSHPRDTSIDHNRLNSQLSGRLCRDGGEDIVSAYKSPAFKTAIRADRFYDGFTLPDYFN